MLIKKMLTVFLVLSMAVLAVGCMQKPPVTEPATETDTIPSSTPSTEEENKVEGAVAPTKKSGRFVYKTSGGMELAFHLNQPRKQVYEYAPLIVNILGGGWTHYEVTNSHYDYLTKASTLSMEGFASMTVSYRGSDHGEKMPDIVADVLDALGYIAQYNDLFKIDLQKVVTVGQSAGGHMGLLLALAPHDFLMKNCAYKNFSYNCIGSVAMVPPTMLYKDAETNRQLFPTWYEQAPGDLLGHLFGINVSVNAEPFIQYSPITYVSAHMPPVLIGGATDDTIVDPKQSILFHQAALDVGGNSTLLMLENADHAWQAVGGAITPSVEEFHRLAYEFVSNLVK
ncbi:MAG: alpha/beta hydrolase [Clostridia bacterium]|nr:alpha/beta hydrolase [Clostridia bacterium]